MLIWLVRHGLTAYGEQKRYQGSLDTQLSPAGREALQAAAFRPERLCVSPMLRAGETAALLFPDVEHQVVPDLREMDFGAFEGRGWWEMEKDADYRAWVGGGCLGRCPGGEDRAAFSARVCTAFEALVTTALADGIEALAVVAHGGTQMAVLERWGRPRRDYYRWQTPCGCGWKLSAENWPEGLDTMEEVCFLK